MEELKIENNTNNTSSIKKKTLFRFRWLSVAKYGVITLGIAVVLFAIFLFFFPLARKYTIVYIKRATHFIYAPPPSHQIIVGQKPLSPPSFSVHGIDVSHHNNTIKWDQVKYIFGSHDTLSFVFIKATEGGNHVDTLFHTNWENSKKSNLLRGAYHYFKPNIPAEQQTLWFIKNVTLLPGDLPPVIDVEESRFAWRYSLDQEVLSMVKYLEAYYQVKPIIYTSHNFYEIYFSGEEFANYPFWIARYTYHHRLSTLDFWEFWQHSETGTVTGIKGAVDVNVFAGTISDLRKLTVGADTLSPSKQK